MPIRLMENFRAVFYSPYYATYELGFYKREGIDVTLLTSDVPGTRCPNCSMARSISPGEDPCG